jgi:hypothetical protein
MSYLEEFEFNLPRSRSNCFIDAKGMNPNHFQMKNRTKKESYQMFHIVNNGGNPSIKWSQEGLIFWKSEDTGLVKPYKKKELRKLPSQGCNQYKVTIKYERQ